MGRRAVREALKRMALVLELNGRSGSAFASAAWTLGRVEEDQLVRRAKRLAPGVGALVAAVLAGEPAPGLAELEAELPAGLFEVARVKGLGPKKVALLYRELGVTSLAELEYAVQENRLVHLSGFGEKTQAKVASSVAQLRAWEGLARRDQALVVVAQVRERHADAEVVGALARGAELVECVELGVPGLAALEETTLAGVPVQLHPLATAVDRVRLTSAAAHWQALVARAAERGLTLDASRLLRAGEPQTVSDPAALYAALGLDKVAVEQREGHALRAASARLVRRSDLRGALHNHTRASDGTGTLEQMREAARALGLHWLGISDHSQTADYARGLDPERLRAQWREIRALDIGHPVRLFTGVESDILSDGSLDYDDSLLDEADVVVSSVHQRYGQSGAVLDARLCKALTHRSTTVWGHPTGRLLLGRAPADFDMQAALLACAEAGCAVELNASPHRLDLGERWLGPVRELGLMVSIAADAHAPSELANLEHGLALARRAGLGPEQVLNCLGAEELLRWEQGRRAAHA